MSWRLVTHLGDAVLVLPLLAVALFWLLFQGHAARRVAWQWASLLLGALALIAASKIAFYGWGTGLRRWDLTCFSGHAVMAWLAWPCLLLLVMPKRYPALRALALLAGAAIATAVAWSRVELGAHPLSEVIAGSVLGIAVAAPATILLRRFALGARMIVIGAALLGPMLWFGQSVVAGLPSERWFAQAGAVLAGNDSAIDRQAWRRQAP